MPPILTHFLIFAQRPGQQPAPIDPNAALAGLMMFFAIFGIFALILTILMIASWWKIFSKAGEPGWAAIVPVYNGMIWAKICGRGEMFGLLLLVPCVNLIIAIMLIFDLAKVFGKGTGYAIGLLLLGIIFLPMLAFGDAQYVGADDDAPSRGKRRRRRDDDEDDEDERPRRRRPAAREEDEEDERPRRRRPIDDDEDEDERPKRPAAQEDRPRRPAPPDERTKRPAPPQPQPKRRPPDEDDDEEEEPRPRRR